MLVGGGHSHVLVLAGLAERPEPRLSAAHPGVFSRLRDKLSGR